MARDRHYYARTMTPQQMREKIDEIEDRITRADTTEAYLADEYALQELNAAEDMVCTVDPENIYGLPSIAQSIAEDRK